MVSILKWQNVVGPPLIEGRGVFVVFWSFCIGFYSILCCSRRAYGPFFKLFFSHFSFFFVQQPLAEPSLQEDTWSGFFFLPLPQKFSFLPKGALTAESKNQICYSQRISSLTYQVADNRFRRWKRGMEVRSQIVESPLRKRMSSAKSFCEAREKGRHWNPSHRQNLGFEMKTWLGRKYPVSIRKNKHRINDPTLDKLIFQFVFRQSVLPLNPQGFMSQLRRLLKSN